MVKLSICITTYNQVDILKKNVENILRYPGDDIQIVVSDNCSQDDIKGMLDAFHDPRIKYCRTASNIGHDGNILNAFRNCDAPYAFLLRTKEKIPAIIKVVCAHPEVGYWRFNCVDEEGQPQNSLSDHIYPEGKQALRSLQALICHPSGELYNLSFLSSQDLDILQDYMHRYFPNHLGFTVHRLLQMNLLCHSALGTSSEFAWIYLSNKAAVHGTVNQAPLGKYIYHPDYQYIRYACEMEYTKKELPQDYRTLIHKLIIRKQCQMITIVYRYNNRNKLEQQHYHFKEEPFSPSKERRTFWHKTLEIIQDYPAEEQRVLKQYARFCLTVMQLRWEASRILGPLIKNKILGTLTLQNDRKKDASTANE